MSLECNPQPILQPHMNNIIYVSQTLHNNFSCKYLHKPVCDLKTVILLEYKKVLFLLLLMESDQTWKHSKHTTKTCF